MMLKCSHTISPHVTLLNQDWLELVGSMMTPLYLLTPWCRVLLEQLIGFQAVKKFPTFHGT